MTIKAETVAQNIINALNERNDAQYSKDNDIAIKLVTNDAAQLLIDAKLYNKQFLETVKAHDKANAANFIAVKAFVKVLQMLNAASTSDVFKLDDYSAIILHNAKALSDAISYEQAAYSLCKQIEFDEEKLSSIANASSSIRRKDVKASTMTTQRSSSKNAFALLDVATYTSDKTIKLNLDNLVCQKLLELV